MLRTSVIQLYITAFLFGTLVAGAAFQSLPRFDNVPVEGTPTSGTSAFHEESESGGVPAIDEPELAPHLAPDDPPLLRKSKRPEGQELVEEQAMTWMRWSARTQVLPKTSNMRWMSKRTGFCQKL